MSFVPIVKARSWQDIACHAYAFIKRYHPQCLQRLQAFPLVDLIEFDMATETSFELEVSSLPPGTEAVTDLLDKRLILSEHTYDGLHRDDGRSRFTVAHELGHIFEHKYLKQRFENGIETLKLKRAQIIPYRDPEAQANIFASALLMPRPAILKMPKDRQRAEIIAEMAKVSRTAAEIRLRNLNKY